MRLITEKQKIILKFIISEIEKNYRPPTIREIGKRVGISSTNGVRDHIKALITKGYIKKTHMKSRGYKLTTKTKREFGRRQEFDAQFMKTIVSIPLVTQKQLFDSDFCSNIRKRQNLFFMEN